MAAQIYPYLTFENAKEAMDYYVHNFGAKILYHQPLNQQQAESLGLDPENLADTTFRAEFTVAGQKLVCADATMANPQASSLVSIMLDFYDDPAEAKELFKLLSSSDQQRVTIPFGPQNGGQMGQVIDKYGITWIIIAGSLEE